MTQIATALVFMSSWKSGRVFVSLYRLKKMVLSKKNVQLSSALDDGTPDSSYGESIVKITKLLKLARSKRAYFGRYNHTVEGSVEFDRRSQKIEGQCLIEDSSKDNQEITVYIKFLGKAT